MNWRSCRHVAEYLIFRLVVCLLRMVSLRQAVRLAETLAFIVHRFLPRKLTRYEAVFGNMRAALGASYSDDQIERLMYRMWVHLFRMIVEIAQLPRKLRLDHMDEVIRFTGSEGLLKALCSERPVILLTGHFGNWEMANAVFGIFGFRMGVVARDLDNPYLHRWFLRYREQYGHRLISKKGGSQEMLALLERGGCLAMLADQDAGPRGLFVDFFGRPASTFKSIALLALQHEALVCVGYARRLPDDFQNNRWVRYELGCEEILDPRDFDGTEAVRQMTQQFTSALERAVRRSPEQYFWLHRRWKSQPGRRKRKKAKPAA